MFRLLLLFVIGLHLHAQADGLTGFFGKWEGLCKLTPSFAGVTELPTSFHMTRIAGKTRWLMINHATGALPEQVRDYELQSVNEAAGHYVLDEKNGLLLDSYLSDGVLRSTFTIAANLVITRFEVRGNELLIDMPMFDLAAVRQTCLTGNPQICAVSYGLRSTQVCVLKKAG